MKLKIPIIIISYNRLSYLKDLVEYFLNLNEEHIYILDNNSTYPPLLDWFEKINKNINVVRYDKNFGHTVYWKTEFYKNIQDCTYCVITDHDIIPYKSFEKEWKENWIEYLNKYKVRKVGSALNLSDIPESFDLKQRVLNQETKFWSTELEKNVFSAGLDTTLFLQKVNNNHRTTNAIRLSNYLIKHRPWYEDLNNQTEENIYYYKSISTPTFYSKVIKKINDRTNI